MRLMGKRQIGELEVSELVSTLILSEIASMPIENQELPVSYALIPIITILTIEVSMSVILMKFPKLKNFISSRPSTIIVNGKLNQKELSRARLSVDELIGELRQKDVTDLNEVNYAILEQSGKLTVIKKAQYKNPTVLDLSLTTSENGIMHILVDNGYVNDHNLRMHNKSYDWLNRKITEQGCTMKDIFLMMVDDSDNICCIRKEHK
jgi:uncharacterized membrane protein YcaP (DUF421 family)